MLATMLQIQAREKLGIVGESWTAFEFQCLPFGEPTQVYRLKGGVEIVGKGGRQAWVKPYKTAIITKTEHEAFCAQWEARTGLCHECEGKREVFAGWNINTGTSMRQCPRCKGIGARPLPNDEKETKQ